MRKTTPRNLRKRERDVSLVDEQAEARKEACCGFELTGQVPKSSWEMPCGSAPR